MEWEIEDEHLDKARAMHRIGLVHRGAVGADGQPARFKLSIALGAGHDGASCPHCHQPVEHGYTLDADGRLRDKDGAVHTPREIAQRYLDTLNEFHGRMDRYAAAHGVPHVKPVKGR